MSAVHCECDTDYGLLTGGGCANCGALKQPDQERFMEIMSILKTVDIFATDKQIELICKALNSQSGITISTDLQIIVNEQANDEGLWCETKYSSEAYMQSALRRLHEVIEGRSSEQYALAALKGEGR